MTDRQTDRRTVNRITTATIAARAVKTEIKAYLLYSLMKISPKGLGVLNFIL